MTMTSQEEEKEAKLVRLLLAYLANIHGVCRNNIAIAQLLFGVHDPYMCLLVVHCGCATVCPPWLLQIRQHL